MSTPPYERYEEKLFIGSSHWLAQNWCSDLPKDLRVLDVGPGSGVMGHFFRQHGISEISAIEIDAETRDALAPVYDSICGSLSELPPDRQFDGVLLMDVLEHMSQPADFLKQLKKHLSPDAFIIISLPNITHWAIRLMMLFGYFEYMDRGPLDRTHLQFFSRRRFLELIRSLHPPLGTQITFAGSIVPLELILPEPLTRNTAFKTFSQLRVHAARLWPALFAYQHLAMVKIAKT